MFTLIGSCDPKEGATAELVQNACSSLDVLGFLASSEKGPIILESSTYKIAPNDYIYIFISPEYSGDEVADGPFSVTFPTIELEFTTTPPEE